MLFERILEVDVHFRDRNLRVCVCGWGERESRGGMRGNRVETREERKQEIRERRKKESKRNKRDR
jgi:hypothetical protein